LAWLLFLYRFFFILTGSCYVAQASLTLMILPPPPPPPECWDYKRGPPSQKNGSGPYGLTQNNLWLSTREAGLQGLRGVVSTMLTTWVGGKAGKVRGPRKRVPWTLFPLVSHFVLLGDDTLDLAPGSMTLKVWAKTGTKRAMQSILSPDFLVLRTCSSACHGRLPPQLGEPGEGQAEHGRT
jgi:hypothetical protein